MLTKQVWAQASKIEYLVSCETDWTKKASATKVAGGRPCWVRRPTFAALQGFANRAPLASLQDIANSRRSERERNNGCGALLLNLLSSIYQMLFDYYTLCKKLYYLAHEVGTYVPHISEIYK